MKTITKIIARYAETDQMGIVHHSVYPIWFEAARTDFIRAAVGIRYSELEALGVMTPLVQLSCRYHSPARYEDELGVETRVTVLTPGRLEFGYRVVSTADNTLLCEGATVHAWVNTKTFRAINMKKHQPELYAKMAASQEEQE